MRLCCVSGTESRAVSLSLSLSLSVRLILCDGTRFYVSLCTAQPFVHKSSALEGNDDHVRRLVPFYVCLLYMLYCVCGMCYCSLYRFSRAHPQNSHLFRFVFLSLTLFFFGSHNSVRQMWKYTQAFRIMESYTLAK